VSDIPPLLLVPLLAVYLPHAVVLSAFDGAQRRLPNRWVASLTLTLALVMALLALCEPPLRGMIGAAAVIALVVGLLGIGFALLAPRLIGMGDAKTAPAVVLMSTALGPEVLIAGALATAVLGGAAGLVVMGATRSAAARFAFGPLLLAGPFLGLLGAPLVAAALGL
jgi:leader peptidase (prepilin peptidase)/N-methyltransferase